MKIALISTDSDLWGFGIRLLSAVVRRAGHCTQLIFLSSERHAYSHEVLEQTAELAKSSDLIGISCFARGSARARQLATDLRRLKSPVIWGGLHATLNPQECASAADIVCRGEGEDVLLDLLEALNTGRPWEGIDNLAFLSRDHLVTNRVRPPHACLDDLPLFDFDRLDEYHLVDDQLVRAGPGPAAQHSEQVPFIGSRGCAFRCTYCCNNRLRELYSGRRTYIRRLSPATHVDRIAELHKRHFPNATNFFLIDEDFFMRSTAEIRTFAELYRERVGIPFECMASPPRVTSEKMAALERAGLWRVRIGVESGSERTKQEVYERPISNDVVLRAARVIHDHPRVVPAYFLIAGNPYEEQTDLLDTLQLMARLPQPYYTQVFNLVFFPGSALYDRALMDGIITGPEDSGYEMHYRRDFAHQGRTWKQKNAYLNALLLLGDGKTTRLRLGLLPRFLLPLLTHPAVVRFVECRPGVSRALIAAKMRALSFRARAGAVLKRVFREPGAVYNMPLYLRTSAKRCAVKCIGVVKGYLIPVCLVVHGMLMSSDALDLDGLF